jgi:hypothetical protein
MKSTVVVEPAARERGRWTILFSNTARSELEAVLLQAAPLTATGERPAGVALQQLLLDVQRCHVLCWRRVFLTASCFLTVIPIKISGQDGVLVALYDVFPIANAETRAAQGECDDTSKMDCKIDGKIDRLNENEAVSRSADEKEHQHLRARI